MHNNQKNISSDLSVSRKCPSTIAGTFLKGLTRREYSSVM